MGLLNEVAKFIFLFKWLRPHSYILASCLSCFLLIAFAHKGSAEHPSSPPLIYTLCHPCPPSKASTDTWYCTVMPESCKCAASSHRKKQSSNDCLLCLCVAMTVKPLFDHSQWILLSQSYTSTPTVRSICCYLKESPPIYDGRLNRMQTKLSDIISWKRRGENSLIAQCR